MTHGANAVNNDSDDVLASIREILEENAASLSFLHTRPAAAPVTNVTNVANASFKPRQAIAEPPIMGVLSRAHIKDNTQRRNMSTDISLEARIDASVKEKLSVDEAMNALARRIGLSIESSDGTRTTSSVSQMKNPAFEKKQEDTGAVREEQLQADRHIMSAIHAAVNDEKFFAQAELVVDETLRPILRKWLETKLQSVVERILREEIAKSLKSMR